MFTKNFYYALHEFMLNMNCLIAENVLAGTIGYTFSDGTKTMTKQYSSSDVEGYLPKSVFYPGHSYGTYNRARFPNQLHGTTSTSGFLFSGYGVLFGSGTTPPTIDDYSFSGNVVSGCTCSQTNTSEIADDGKSSQWQTVFTITNNNTDAVTIGEVGVFTEVYLRNSSAAYEHKAIMLDRTVLETPITIEPGGVGQVTATWRMEAPPTT